MLQSYGGDNSRTEYFTVRRPAEKNIKIMINSIKKKNQLYSGQDPSTRMEMSLFPQQTEVLGE